MKTRIEEIRNAKTRNFVAETFGQPSNGSMKHQNGLDEFDLAAAAEGDSSYRLNSIRPRRRLAMVRTN